MFGKVRVQTVVPGGAGAGPSPQGNRSVHDGSAQKVQWSEFLWANKCDVLRLIQSDGDVRRQEVNIYSPTKMTHSRGRTASSWTRWPTSETPGEEEEWPANKPPFPHKPRLFPGCRRSSLRSSWTSSDVSWMKLLLSSSWLNSQNASDSHTDRCEKSFTFGEVASKVASKVTSKVASTRQTAASVQADPWRSFRFSLTVLVFTLTE